VARTADLLKFLGRNPKLKPADQDRILRAVAAKLEAVREPFTHGEPERLARAVLSLALRQDARQAALQSLVETLHAREEAMWRKSSRPDPGAYAAVQNGRQLMLSLCVLLDRQNGLQPPAQALRAKLLTALP
jgi:Protein of unknown function (DUF2785)